MKKRLIVYISLFLFGLFFIGYIIFWSPNNFEGDRFIIVSKGENFQQVVDSLESAGIIRSRFLFDIAGRLSGYTTKMQIGRYRFKSGVSNFDILDNIRYGKTIEAITLTIPEGWRTSRLAKMLAKQVGIDSSKFSKLVHDSNFVRSIGVQSNSLAGYLMPKTYNFYWQTDEEKIIKVLVDEFWKYYDSTLQRQTKIKKLTINEVLTMASIIEQETAIDSERAIIAGVYYNRLKKHMRLQADPTIQYILEEGPRRLHQSDLEKDSPYNTYRHFGLPPGPINSPGKASILAAIFPAKHKYLYFVATGYGGHTFSKTYDEHKRAARAYHKFKEEQRAREEGGAD